MPRQSTATSTAPMTNTPRPPLPTACFNPKIREMSAVPQVKFQRISRPPKEVMVGRIKILTPDNGHAFILRRFDTGAISITTLFRAAFPTASEQAEKDEIGWVAHNFDLTGANGGRDEDRVRFSGRWAEPHVARMLADSYGLPGVLDALLAARPDEPTPAKVTARAPPPQLPPMPATPGMAKALQPSTTPATAAPPPAKRRKDAASPAPAPQSSPAKRVSKLRSPSPAPVPVPATLRRSTRARSVSAKPESKPRASPRKKPAPAVPEYSDETVVDAKDEDAQAEAAVRPTYDEDIADQRQLIAQLTAARDATLGAAEKAAGKVAAAFASDESDAGSAAAIKRARPADEEQYSFDFKAPGGPGKHERALVTNSRTRGAGPLQRLAPAQRSAIWGGLALAVGFGAATLLPIANYFAL